MSNPAESSPKLRLGVLASGSGSNLQAIIDRCQDGSLNAEITIVISNIPGAGALDRANQAGLATRCIDHTKFADRRDFDREVVAELRAADVELVVLAGFMRIISQVLLDAYDQKIINIHPALLPAFPGLQVQQKALDYGAKFTGCTVHFVDAGVDTGPIIIQAVVPVLDTDNAESLAARILKEEHRIYPRAIQLIAEGRLRVQDRRVILDPPLEPDCSALHNPPLG